MRREWAKQELDTTLSIFNSAVPPKGRVGSMGDLDDEDFDHCIIF